MDRYCVVCGKLYGPNWANCCVDGSVVGTAEAGFFKKRRCFYSLSGQPLTAQQVETIRKASLERVQATQSTTPSRFKSTGPSETEVAWSNFTAETRLHLGPQLFLPNRWKQMWKLWWHSHRLRSSFRKRRKKAVTHLSELAQTGDPWISARAVMRILDALQDPEHDIKAEAVDALRDSRAACNATPPWHSIAVESLRKIVRGDCPKDRYGIEPYSWLRDSAKDALRKQFGYELNQEESRGLQTTKAAQEESVYKRLGFRPGDRVLLVEPGFYNGFSGTVTSYGLKTQTLSREAAIQEWAKGLVTSSEGLITIEQATNSAREQRHIPTTRSVYFVLVHVIGRDVEADVEVWPENLRKLR